MWPLVVVTVDEVVEPGLLLKEVFSCRFGGLQLEGEVHALVASVLLRATGLDAFHSETSPVNQEWFVIYVRCARWSEP